MSHNLQDRQEILQLLATGKITAAEAAELLQAITVNNPEPEKVPIKPNAPSNPESIKVANQDETPSKPRWLHVQVTDLKTGKGKVTVNLPLNLVRSGLNISRKLAPELNDLTWDDLSNVFSSEMGTLVDVVDEEDGEQVRIYVD